MSKCSSIAMGSIAIESDDMSSVRAILLMVHEVSDICCTALLLYINFWINNSRLLCSELSIAGTSSVTAHTNILSSDLD